MFFVREIDGHFMIFRSIVAWPGYFAGQGGDCNRGRRRAGQASEFPLELMVRPLDCFCPLRTMKHNIGPKSDQKLFHWKIPEGTAIQRRRSQKDGTGLLQMG